MAQNTKNNNNNGGGSQKGGGDCCSFCGKRRADVELMFSSNQTGANICNECIENGYKIIVDNDRLTFRRRQAAPLTRDELLKPMQIKEFLDQYVIGQDEAKRYMAVAVYNHYKRLMYAPQDDGIEIDKSNIVLVGPTGTGKTLMARTIARLLKVPFTIVDATVLTEAGYVGEDVESILSRLLQVADYDVEQAERGIVFIDEIDKIAGRSAGGHGPDVSREGVQRDILPIVEGSTVNTKYGPVKTDFMLFIAAGAFHVAKVTDLIPELQGRFPVRVTLKSLTQEDMKRILTQTDNALTKQYAALLAVDHVHLHFDESALDALSLAAYVANETNEDIGARRLHTIFEQLLEDISFNAGGDMPDVDVNINGDYVREHLGEAARAQDLKRYIL